MSNPILQQAGPGLEKSGKMLLNQTTTSDKQQLTPPSSNAFVRHIRNGYGRARHVTRHTCNIASHSTQLSDIQIITLR